MIVEKKTLLNKLIQWFLGRLLFFFILKIDKLEQIKHWRFEEGTFQRLADLELIFIDNNIQFLTWLANNNLFGWMS